jgi:hypothetical protein
MDTPEDEKTKLISCLGAFRQFWSGLSQVSTAFLVHPAVPFIVVLDGVHCCTYKRSYIISNI